MFTPGKTPNPTTFQGQEYPALEAKLENGYRDNAREHGRSLRALLRLGGYAGAGLVAATVALAVAPKPSAEIIAPAVLVGGAVGASSAGRRMGEMRRYGDSAAELADVQSWLAGLAGQEVPEWVAAETAGAAPDQMLAQPAGQGPAGTEPRL